MALEMFQLSKTSHRVKDFETVITVTIDIISHYENPDLQTLMLTLIIK